jgi:phosphoribosyl 1,2-cyclic phosphodiesterase
MQITCWGVRGSIPTPGPDTVQVGGNTSCFEVRCGQHIIIFDGGTGLRLLGQKLLRELPIEAFLLFSHVHWDHIQGFPFFAPAFIPGNKIHLYGGSNVSRTLEETLAGQMDYPSFPVHLSEMGAQMDFNDLREGQVLQIGDEVRVSNARGNHPNGVYAYRVDYQGKSVVYATDTEHYSIVDPKLLRLCKNVDLLIYDAMYTPEEYAGEVGGMAKTGWGHSTFTAAVALAQAAGAKKLVLHHHDPAQTDALVFEKERRCQELFPNTVAGREGMVFDL